MSHPSRSIRTKFPHPAKNLRARPHRRNPTETGRKNRRSAIRSPSEAFVYRQTTSRIEQSSYKDPFGCSASGGCYTARSFNSCGRSKSALGREVVQHPEAETSFLPANTGGGSSGRTTPIQNRQEASQIDVHRLRTFCQRRKDPIYRHLRHAQEDGAPWSRHSRYLPRR